MIDIDNITFSYGSNVVLKNITMHLEEGRIYGLLGENGVGKTTLLTLLCGLKKVKSGHIEIDGHIPFNREPSFLSLEYFLSDEVAPMPAEAEKFASSYGRFWEKFDMSKFLELMQIFETDPKQKMNRMSFGQLKKTYISFALACNCKYLFMDEPTNGLDIPSKAQFRKAVTKCGQAHLRLQQREEPSRPLQRDDPWRKRTGLSQHRGRRKQGQHRGPVQHSASPQRADKRTVQKMTRTWHAKIHLTLDGSGGSSPLN